MSASSPSKSTIPSEIGGYKIESLLSRGGMSLIYLGFSPKTKELTAVKVLSSKYLAKPEAIEHFLHEAKVIEVTNHPNIVRLYGHGKWEGGVYIAMEFVQGIDLRQMILQQAMSLKRSIEIMIQVCHAVAHLHAQGIIHRDLKPENILLTAQGGVKVIDFGVAQIYNVQAKEKQLMGTPSYMSPELRKDSKNVSFASDIFALGVIIYEMILGRLSHGTIQLSLVPRGMQKILAKALQPDPKQRYEDIIDLVSALSEYLNSEEIQKDMRGSDYIGELNEDLKEAQSLLIPKVLPQWDKIKLGFASNCNMAISAVYYDFFTMQDGVYTIVMGESLATGVKGLLEISMLRGMVRALAKTVEEPTKLVATLNNRLVDLEVEYPFSFSLLTLVPKEGRLSFISCGYTPLWHVPAGVTVPRRLTSNNIALGIEPDVDFFEVNSNWAVGDSIVLHTFQAGLAKNIKDVEQDEALFVDSLKESSNLTPQKLVDAVFRRISMQQGQAALFEKLVTIICIEREV